MRRADHFCSRRRASISARIAVLSWAGQWWGRLERSCLALGAVAGHPGGHRGPAHPELGGHVCLRDPVVQVAVDHPESAGGGQGCVSVGHEWVFSGRWVV